MSNNPPLSPHSTPIRLFPKFLFLFTPHNAPKLKLYECRSTEAMRRTEPKRVSNSKVEALKDIPGQTCSMLVDEIRKPASKCVLQGGLSTVC